MEVFLTGCFLSPTTLNFAALTKYLQETQPSDFPQDTNPATKSI